MHTSSWIPTFSLSHHYQLIINNATHTNLWLPPTSALTADQARHIGLARRALQMHMARSNLPAFTSSLFLGSIVLVTHTHTLFIISVYIHKTARKRETNHATCFQDQKDKSYNA